MERRKYEVVLIGATGYTGALTAKHIVKHFPEDVEWAIAGRSAAKLEALAAELREIDSKRVQPDIIVVDIDGTSTSKDAWSIDSVVKRARVCISVVSYGKVGHLVIEACIEHKSDYIDTAGGTDLIKPWVDKYHKKAEDNDVILVHACGMLSGPHDVLANASATTLRRTFGSTVKEFVLVATKYSLAVSGGTFESISSHAKIDPKAAAIFENPWALSPIQGRTDPPTGNAIGVRDVQTLGLVSKYAPTGGQDQGIVHRTWGLLRNTDSDLGPNFQFNEYHAVGSTIGGLFALIQLTVLGFAMKSAIVIALLRYVMPAPGSGPDVKKAEKMPTQLEGVAIPDKEGVSPVRAVFEYPSGPYHTTALFLAEGAASLLWRTGHLEAGAKGGCLTSAMLGQDLINRLRKAGATVTTEFVEPDTTGST